MSEAPAAGWYPDPNDDSSERWWGGTGWTANTRPLRQMPGQAPPPPVPAAVAPPPAGWYADPQDAAGEKWFDGAHWSQATRQLPTHEYAGPPGHSPTPPGHSPAPPGQSGFRGVSHSSHGRPVITSVAVLLVGLILMGMGAILGFSSKAPGNMSATATATVTSVEVHQVSAKRARRGAAPSCTPVAEFEVGGMTYQAKMVTGSSPCPWTVGQQVAVAYDPASPSEAMIPITGMKQLWYWLLVGIGALMVGASLYLWRRRKGRQGVTSQ